MYRAVYKPDQMKAIPNFPGYAITRDGRIWSHKSNKWLKTGTVNGYVTVCLYRDSCMYSTVLVHRLVLETYVGPCPVDMECRHLDGDRINNNLSNLQWATHQKNMYDRLIHGTQASGEKHGNSKLINKQVVKIRELLIDGWTQKELAKRFGVNQQTIRRVYRREAYLEVNSV